MDLKRINELTSGVEWYLKQLSNFTVELKGVRDDLRKLKEFMERDQTYEIQKMQQQITALTGAIQQQGIMPPNEYELELEQIKQLINGGEWPQAIPEERICRTESQESDRAKSLLNLFISEYLKDKRFLDFGCGKGLVPMLALENESSFALGYDILEQWNSDNEHCTTDWKVVEAGAPYDVILIHDVLDHIEMYDPIEALRKVKSVMSSDGRIYVRNHPWSSRHGGHIYLQKNLAFLHLFLDEVELTRIEGLVADYNIKVYTPLQTYPHWFKEAGLNVDLEIPIKTPVEEYFKKNISLHSKLIKQWPQGEDPCSHMEIDFVEYVLSSAGASDHQIL